MQRILGIIGTEVSDPDFVVLIRGGVLAHRTHILRLPRP
jgi:hypothetical protein